jgi:hypothetical protein
MAFCKNISTSFSVGKHLSFYTVVTGIITTIFRSQNFENTALRVFNERHLMLFVDLHLNTRSLILICKSYNSCFKMFLLGGRVEIFKGSRH